MTTIAQTDPVRVIIGVDTHLDNHVAAAVNGVGVHLGDTVVSTNKLGYQQLIDWAQNIGDVEAFGVEGTGSFGAGLTRHLIAEGFKVVEVNRPDRSQRHRLGKSDPIDAQLAARAVLMGVADVEPKSGNDYVEMLRVLRVARNTAVKAKTQAMNALRVLIVNAPDELRSQLRKLFPSKLITTVAAFRPGNVGTTTAANRMAMRTLGRRIIELQEEIDGLDGQIDLLTAKHAPALREVFGVGADGAAELLEAAGDNPQRIHSESAFARMCGVAPMPASSGKTTRHRLSRGGNRRANAVLHRIVIVRLRWHQPTKDYIERRTAEGKTKAEIIRCLKRYVAREVFTAIQHPSTDKPVKLAA